MSAFVVMSALVVCLALVVLGARVHSRRGASGVGSAYTPAGAKKTAERCLRVLRGCRGRRDVLDALSKIMVLDSCCAPAASRARAALEADPTLDPLRVRDDYVRVYAAFVASLRAF